MSTAAKRTINMVHYPLADDTNPQQLDDYLDTIDTNVTAKIGGSTGSNDNRVIRSDGTAGKTIQATGISVDDSDNMSGVATLMATTLSPTNALAINKGGTANTTATAAFDALAPTTTRGDIITRGASSNGRLALGASGAALVSDGTDLVFGSPAGGVTTIASGSLPAAATQNITSIPATYAHLVLYLSGVSFDTATRDIRVSVSTDNGSSFDTTAANYVGYSISGVPALANWSIGSLGGASNIAAAATLNMQLTIFNYQGGMNPLSIMRWVSGATEARNTINYVGSTSAINGLQIFISGSGSFDAGTYALYGIK